MSLRWLDLHNIKDAIADVRNDKTPTNWVLLSYAGENSNDVQLVGAGDGGLNELIPHLKPENVGYGLIRITERFDNSDTVKFVFIKWVGESIHRMLRARLGTHSGAVKEILAPYHVDIDATNLSEISEDIVTKTVSKASGTALHVREVQGGSASHSPSQLKHTSASSGSGYVKGGSPAGPPKSENNVKFDDEGAIKRAIQDLRSDATPTNWVLLTYDGPNSNTIKLAGSGTGGSAELISHLRDDNVGYGLVRQDERYDDSIRVMFAYINWVGENIHRMLKARLGTHSGSVKGILTPYHADIDATNHSEISPEIITTTIRRTMGTATRVLN
jgi:hypothetical protein